MKLLSMTATFGKLQNAHIDFTDGLNIRTLPNEAGKSTWSEFLLAMLYGIDTTQRTTKTNLAVKTKYKPWSGAAMAGTIEVEQDSKIIVIERTSRGRVPLGEFRAYEKGSGAEIPGMTGENCGQMLLGVPAAVFARSAFIGQNALAVTADSSLESRLSALVSSGDETVNAKDAAKRLHEAKNHIRHNKTGFLPQAQAELAAVNSALDKIHATHKNNLSVSAKEQQLLARQEELERILSGLSAQKAAEKLAQKDLAAKQAEQAKDDYEGAEKAVSKLPPQETLQTIRQQLLSQEPVETASIPEKPLEPACPPVFAGCKEDEILPKAQRDALEFDKLVSGKHQPLLPPLIGAAFLLAAVIVNLLRQDVVLSLVCLLGFGAMIALALKFRKENRLREEKLTQAEKLLDAYGRRSRDEFVPYAAEYHTKLLLYRQQLSQYEAALSAQTAKKQASAENQARLLGSVQTFAPEVKTLQEAISACEKALAFYAIVGEHKQRYAAAVSRFEAISAALGNLTAAPAPTEDFSGYDEKQIKAELSAVQSSLTQCRSALDVSRGSVAAIGDEAALQAQKEALTEKISTLERRFAALELAEQTLAKASTDLQSRFAPAINEEAAKIFAELTASRYDRVLFDREFRLLAGTADDLALHETLTLSSGTADQLYLALRLAICHLVLSPDVPILLDDALVRFDDSRLAAAVKVLQKEAASRQIILFTCQGREDIAAKSLNP